MVWFLASLVVVVLAVAAVAGSGRLGEMPPAVHDAPVLDLPDGDLTGAYVRATQFALTARGYSPAQVDDLLERLATQLERPLHPSAIMDPIEFSQPRREGEHGSNEAPHG